VRVFAFDRAYLRHYPTARLVDGSLRPGGAVLSVEAAGTLRAMLGTRVEIRLPGRDQVLRLPVTGHSDLSRARPLFYSRESSRLEAFLYVPNSVVVDPGTFRRVVLPAYRTATAARGDQLKSLPFLEVDVRLRRADLHADPATALLQAKAVARSIQQIAPRQDYLIDNASNTLQVARDDAAAAKRMFVVLGLPGALLAAFLTAYAGGILAAAQRREQANLRIRGAHRGHLARMLVYRTGVIAGLGSGLGTVLGLLSAVAVLGTEAVSRTSPATLATTAVLVVTVGILCTGLALYAAGRRTLRREIGSERSELALGEAPLWHRYRADLMLLAAVAVATLVVLRTEAFAGEAGSTYFGRAVDIPVRPVLVPLALWGAGALVAVRVFLAVGTRMPLPRGRHSRGPVVGLLVRTVRRRTAAMGSAVLALALVVAFGTSLAYFSASYASGKVADARFALGSDVRVTPSVLSRRPQPPGLSSELRVGAVTAVTAVVFATENAVLTSDLNEDRVSLAAVEPAGFRRVARPPDSAFTGASAADAMAALGAGRRTVLVDRATADDLGIRRGDGVVVLLARGTVHQSRVPVHVVGFFTRLPGFPEGVNVVANLRDYHAATGLEGADFFLGRTADRGAAGLARAVDALRSGPGRHLPLRVDTSATTLDKDQTSLTALNIRGLMALDTFYTLLMAAAAIALFVFGLILQRRREYVTLRAQGMRTREVSALVVGEAAAVAAYATVVGVLVGSAMGYLLVQGLRPLFVLRPAVTFPLADVAVLVAMVGAATIASGLGATALLRRLRPAELLREE
jgi:putative ABC transport system permease protein